MKHRAVISLALLFATGCLRSEAIPRTPQQAEQALREGNDRFARDHARHPHASADRRHETARDGQHPFAAIVACSDSRVPVELLFDQGIGDLFVIRVAGNVCGVDEAGSIEYAVEHLHLPLVVVLGHEHCGAVKAVVDGSHEHGSLEKLITRIRPAVDAVRRERSELSGEALLHAAVERNVWHSLEELLAVSADIRRFMTEDRLQVVGAVYDIDSARVTWLGPHPRQAELLRTGAAPANCDK
ncbi:MAG: carbonic anhydrase [Phycisphaerae bacterium]|nr:MAG: carbonic anhydrase [Planctomycetia bacterium]GJQ26280.1 MAG: carbonic anhydrase [Phycisphaerae bacterium]